MTRTLIAGLKHGERDDAFGGGNGDNTAVDNFAAGI